MNNFILIIVLIALLLVADLTLSVIRYIRFNKHCNKIKQLNKEIREAAEDIKNIKL